MSAIPIPPHSEAAEYFEPTEAMTVFLAYTGDPAQREEAHTKLRHSLAGIVFISKASDIVEAQMEPSAVQQIDHLSAWKSITPAYADIEKPPLNLARMQAKFARN